jgi:DNA polymerase III subunit alpha
MAATMTLDIGNTDKLAEFRNEARGWKSVEPPSINRPARDFDVAARDGALIRYALAALKGVGDGRSRRSSARGEKPFAISPISPRPASIRARSTSGCWKALPPPAPSTASSRKGARVSPPSTPSSRSPTAPRQSRTRGRRVCSAGWACEDPAARAESRTLAADRTAQREYDAVGFFLSGHPLDDYGSALKRLRVQSWAEFVRSVKAGAGAGRLAASVVSRVERRTKTGNKMGVLGLSDPTGHFEAVIFAEGLAQFRDLLEPGAAVLLQVGGEAQGDDVRVRIHNVESLDEAAAKTQRGLRVVLESSEPIELVAKRLNGGTNGRGDATGEVSLLLRLDGGAEVEVKLAGRYPISPQIAGAMKAVPGVLEVESL